MDIFSFQFFFIVYKAVRLKFTVVGQNEHFFKFFMSILTNYFPKVLMTACTVAQFTVSLSASDILIYENSLCRLKWNNLFCDSSMTSVIGHFSMFISFWGTFAVNSFCLFVLFLSAGRFYELSSWKTIVFYVTCQEWFYELICLLFGS